MLTEADNIYLDLPESELIEIYSKLDKERYPDKAQALETALRLKMQRPAEQNKYTGVEQKWKKAQILRYIIPLLLFVLLITSKYFYTPDISEIHNYAIVSMLISVALISGLLVMAMARNLFAALLLVLYFFYIMFGFIF